MDLRLELSRTSKWVVASPKGDLVSLGFLSRHSRAGLWILPSLRDWLAEWICGRVVASPKGDLGFCWVSFPRHSRAGLWILPSLRDWSAERILWVDTGTAYITPRTHLKGLGWPRALSGSPITLIGANALSLVLTLLLLFADKTRLR
jgi:hypothetical protein